MFSQAKIVPFFQKMVYLKRLRNELIVWIFLLALIVYLDSCLDYYKFFLLHKK